MDTTLLSNYQAFRLAQNRQLDHAIRSQRKDLLAARLISSKEWAALEDRFCKDSPVDDRPLHIGFKCALLLVPFCIVLLLLLTAHFQGNGMIKRRRQFWIFWTFGMTGWIILVFMIAASGVLTSSTP